MSDSATPTPTTPSSPAPAAPQAPAPQPGSTPASQTPAHPTEGAPAAPAAPEGPKEPQSVREAKQALRRGGDRYPSTVAEAKAAAGKTDHHAQNQPRAEDGKFASPATPDGQGPQGSPPAADAAAGAATDSSAAPAPDPNAPAAQAPDATPAPDASAAPEVPEGMVRIDIPEGHPMRHRGDHYLVPKGHEEYHRWAVNNTIRHQDVDGYAKSAKEWQQYANRLKAELDATREFTGGIFKDPAVIAQIEDIRNTYGDDAARRFEAGLWQEQQAKVQELTQQQETEAQQAEKQTYVQNFMQRAYGEAEKRFPGMTPQEIGTAIAAYGSYVEARNGEQLDLNEFLKHAAPLALQNPQVRAEAERRRNARLEQERQVAAKAEADRLAAEERKKLEEAAAKRAQYPWMQVPAGAVPAQVGVDDGAGGPRTVHEARQSLRRRRRA